MGVGMGMGVGDGDGERGREGGLRMRTSPFLPPLSPTRTHHTPTLQSGESGEVLTVPPPFPTSPRPALPYFAIGVGLINARLNAKCMAN